MINYLPDPPKPRLDPVFHALSDETRRKILTQLCDGPAAVSRLAAPLAVSLPAVLQHLKVLESSGLIESRKSGRVRTCTLAPAGLKAAGDWLAERRAFWESALDRLTLQLADPAAFPTPAKDPSWPT